MIRFLRLAVHQFFCLLPSPLCWFCLFLFIMLSLPSSRALASLVHEPLRCSSPCFCSPFTFFWSTSTFFWLGTIVTLLMFASFRSACCRNSPIQLLQLRHIC
uniref:ATMMH-1 (ARABIDOPSIS THALIANA MUTM HOMOLOG-1) n=1 Tax=Arundo donax TaxID=35708 RepID=A0A0A9CVG3_ARUDO